MNEKIVNESRYYIIAIGLCFLFLIWIMQLWLADLTIPFNYGGDAIFGGMFIKGIIENGWILNNPYIGMPTGFLSYDFPSNCFLDYIILKLISFVFSNWGLSMNIYYLLTFPLIIISSLYTLRKLNISPILSILGSLLFTFIPYHFLRGENHLTLSSYYMIPLMVLVIIWIFEDNFLFSRTYNSCDKKILNKKNLFSIFICIGMALTFGYYPFFSCFFLLVAGICATIGQKKYTPILNAGILIGIIILCLVASNLPTILYQYDNGKNVEVALRSPLETEIYGLKIIQLILPIQGHRIPIFAHISDLYATHSPLINENSYVALGIIGSIGFIFLILWIFYQLFTKTTINNNETTKKIHQLSILNLSAVLLATIGGFGTIFACFIYPQIRCYNRISIFIAFFCIVTTMLLLDILLQRLNKTKPKKMVIFGCIAIILIFGIYDQTSTNFIPDYKNTKDVFLNDAHFIKTIETTFPNDTMIFQLPYIPFPENPPVYNMTDYDHFRAYLHSENIHWSYGTMKGRDGDLWQREIVRKPVKEMVESLSTAGFNGIYLDSFGYVDNGKEIISEISSVLQKKPIISENNRLYFFDLTN